MCVCVCVCVCKERERDDNNDEICYQTVTKLNTNV